jgi:hypothetical protein
VNVIAQRPDSSSAHRSERTEEGTVKLRLAAVLFVSTLAGCLPPPDDSPDDSPATDPALDAILAYADQRASAPGLPTTVDKAELYELVAFDSADADQVMTIGDGSTGIPPALQGLWWMDGNPLADKLVSFGASPWNANTHQTSIVVYGEGIWSWHGDLEGRALYASVRAADLVYELSYDENLTFATITPTVKVGPVRVRVPASIVRFTATRISDDLWLRHSYLHERLVHTYAFRRVVRGDGTREPAYDEYVAAAPPTSFIAERVAR